MTTESNIHTAIHEKTLEKLLERIEQSTLADPDYQCKNAFKKGRSIILFQLYWFTVTNRDVLELHSLFGTLAHRSLQILDTSTVRYYLCENRTPVIIVEGNDTIPYAFYAGCNYCSCDSFKYNVKVHKLQYTCKHNLASRLAIALKREQIVTITLTQYKKLLRHIEKVAQ